MYPGFNILLNTWVTMGEKSSSRRGAEVNSETSIEEVDMNSHLDNVADECGCAEIWEHLQNIVIIPNIVDQVFGLSVNNNGCIIFSNMIRQ